MRALSLGGLREGFWGHSERQWGPPQVKHPVAGGLAVEGGRRSPEAGDRGGTGLVGGSAGVPVELGVVVICVRGGSRRVSWSASTMRAAVGKSVVPRRSTSWRVQC